MRLTKVCHLHLLVDDTLLIDLMQDHFFGNDSHLFIFSWESKRVFTYKYNDIKLIVLKPWIIQILCYLPNIDSLIVVQSLKF